MTYDYRRSGLEIRNIMTKEPERISNAKKAKEFFMDDKEKEREAKLRREQEDDEKRRRQEEHDAQMQMIIMNAVLSTSFD